MIKEVVTPVSSEGNEMSPFERRTGVILPIWGTADGPTNRHHAHFYKRLYEKGPREQRAFLRAVRFSRLQRVSKADHRIYHDAFEGTQFPQNEKQAFRTTILNESGYIPPWVVDVTNGSPAITETTPIMRHVLRQLGIMSIERPPFRRAEIGQFLMYYALKQPLDHVKTSLLEEFAHLTQNVIRNNEQLRERKLELGLKLTNIAIGVAVEPIEKPFQQARDELLLPESAPVCAFHEVKQFVQGYEPDYYDTLQEQIAISLAS